MRWRIEDASRVGQDRATAFGDKAVLKQRKLGFINRPACEDRELVTNFLHSLRREDALVVAQAQRDPVISSRHGGKQLDAVTKRREVSTCRRVIPPEHQVVDLR